MSGEIAIDRRAGVDQDHAAVPVRHPFPHSVLMPRLPQNLINLIVSHVGDYMPRSTTWAITTKSIYDKDLLGPILLRLMLASNDITIANDCWKEWHGEYGDSNKNRQPGAKMYFVRLLLAHLHEAMKIIRDIKKTPKLMEAVEACEEKTQRDFATVWALVGTKDYKSIITMRNKIGSHWDDDVVAPALAEMNAKTRATRCYCHWGTRCSTGILIRPTASSIAS